MKNRLCEMLEIEYPVVQGAMQWLSLPGLAAAVSNAGGLGIITAATYPDKKALVNAIRQLKQLTPKPFAVNVSLFPRPSIKEQTQFYLEAILEESVPVVETSGRSPEEYLPVLKSAGIRTMHKVSTVKHAKKAQDIGVDIITVVGYECGGHPGLSDTTTMVKIREAAKQLQVPLIAGGGIVDGAGLAAALLLGADAVVMGTRFIASNECSIHQRFKERICDSEEADTVLAQQSIDNPVRILKNETALKILCMEDNGATLEELMRLISGQITRLCYEEGRVEDCAFPMGQAAALIHDILPVRDIILQMVKEASKIVPKLAKEG